MDLCKTTDKEGWILRVAVRVKVSQLLLLKSIHYQVLIEVQDQIEVGNVLSGPYAIVSRG